MPVDHVVTDHLELSAMTVDDAPELYRILSDPAGWWFDPDARHTDLATSTGFARRAADRWPTDRLSYWTARARDTGAVVGLGGAQRHRTGSWNISYRIASEHQGKGYAVELGRAALAAAAEIDDTVPCIAWVLPANVASRVVAERLGLHNYGERVDANDGVVRLAYSDRPLDE